jgi:cellulose synthase/poly-beta-1,6-N-acetylglucosamine synthase-like glycosyltransferase
MIHWLSGYTHVALVTLNSAILDYFLVINTCYLLLMATAAAELWRYHREKPSGSHQRELSAELMPRITMLVPAYNEATTIEPSLRALLTLDYADLEVVVVDDGSTDGTVDLMVDAFDLIEVQPIHHRHLATERVETIYRSRRFPHLVIATKSNGGKSDALNAALNLATGELVCAVDADTIIEHDALPRLVRPFVRSDDVVAAGATVRVANGCAIRFGRIVDERPPNRPLGGIQAMEYLRSFLFGRLGWNRLGGNLVISGACGLFRRDALIDSGGYADTVGEDMELIVRLRRLGYEQNRPSRIEFVPDPVAWTEVPESLAELGRQRDRWHRGLTDVLWRHRRLMLNPRYGLLGMVCFPAFLLVEWLGPIVEALGLVAVPVGLLLDVIDVPFALLFIAAAYGLGLVQSAVALLLEELVFRRYGRPGRRAMLLLWAVFEAFGYRQLTVFWRLRGIVGFVRGRTEWGAMRRTGFHSEAGRLTPHP